jgi:hypothetical protein
MTNKIILHYQLFLLNLEFIDIVVPNLNFNFNFIDYRIHEEETSKLSP